MVDILQVSHYKLGLPVAIHSYRRDDIKCKLIYDFLKNLLSLSTSFHIFSKALNLVAICMFLNNQFNLFLRMAKKTGKDLCQKKNRNVVYRYLIYIQTV